MENNLIDIYDEKYLNNYHSSPGKRYRNIFTKVSLKNTDDILDIGCGNGLLYRNTKNKVKKYTGVDFSKTFIKRCKKLYKENKENFFCANIIEFCKNKENQFTKTFMLDFTEHVYDKELSKIMETTHQTLKPGGELYIHTPNKDYILERIKEKGIIKQTTGHVAVRNKKQYKQMLKKAGFSKINSIILPHYNFLGKLHILRKLPLLGKFFEARLLIIATK